MDKNIFLNLVPFVRNSSRNCWTPFCHTLSISKASDSGQSVEYENRREEKLSSNDDDWVDGKGLKLRPLTGA